MLEKFSMFKILMVMKQTLGKSASQISRQANITYSGGSKTIKEMIEKGMVGNAKDYEIKLSSDKRGVYLILTKKGLKLRNLFREVEEILNEN